MNKEVLEKLIKYNSPSGREYCLQKEIKEYMKDRVDYQIKDDQGDLVNVINKDSEYKVLLAAHIDEISLIVDGYNSNGTLKVSGNGGVSASIYLGSQVNVITDEGDYNGVVGTNHSLDKKGDLKANDLFIDLGMSLEEVKTSLNLTETEVMGAIELCNIYGYQIDFVAHPTVTNPNDYYESDTAPVVQYKSRESVLLKCVLAELNGLFIDGVGYVQFNTHKLIEGRNIGSQAAMSVYDGRSFYGHRILFNIPMSGMSETPDFGF